MHVDLKHWMNACMLTWMKGWLQLMLLTLLLLLQTLVVMQNAAPNGNASEVAKGQKMPLRRQHNVPMLASTNTCIQKFAS